MFSTREQKRLEILQALECTKHDLLYQILILNINQTQTLCLEFSFFAQNGSKEGFRG